MIDMIAQLPSGLDLHEDTVEDLAIQQAYPVNTTAALFFSLVDGKRSLAVISRIIAEKYQQDQQRVTDDVVALSRYLQQHFLLNLYEGWRQMILRWIVCVIHFVQPAFYPWRYAIPATRSYAKI